MKHTLPGQLDLPALPEAPAEAPKPDPLPEQKPCDIGLFSVEDAMQIDLVDWLEERSHEGPIT